jgi:predicted secreted protein
MAYTGSQAFAGRGSTLERGDGDFSETFTPIAELRKITRSGSKADLADVTNMESGAYREKLPTLLEPGEISFEGNYIPSDATQGYLQTDFDNQALHNWQIVLPGSRGTWSFKAYVTAIDVPDLQVDKEALITGKLTITGAPSFSAS